MLLELCNKDVVKISKLILLECKNYLGPCPKDRPLPKIKIYKKQTDYCAEYDTTINRINIYIKNIKSMFMLVRILIHEYTHYIQMHNGKTISSYNGSNKRVGYENNPYEICADLNAGWYGQKIYNKLKRGGAI